MRNVRELYLKKTFFKAKFLSFITNHLVNLSQVESENFQLCCLIWKIFSENVFCRPSPSGFFTCKNIIPSRIMKILFWTFGILGLIGNLFSITLLLIKKMSSFIYRVCFAFGDFLTSVYMLVIAVVDLHFSEEKYLENEEEWRNGKLCSFLGTMLTFGLFLTLNSILLISVERFESISNPFNMPIIKKKQREITCFILVYSLIISTFPLMVYHVNVFFKEISLFS